MPQFANLARDPSAKNDTVRPPAPLQARHRAPTQTAQSLVLQLRADEKARAAPAPAPATQSRSGLPPVLRAGIETLSGLAMDDVRVHRDSAEPAKLGALAFTRGSDIHLAPGQEQHLPHEAWHVVQQKQGRVQATTQMKGVAVNEDKGLEAEADRMASRITSASSTRVEGERFPKVAPKRPARGSAAFPERVAQFQKGDGLVDERTWEPEHKKTAWFPGTAFSYELMISSRSLIEYMPATPVKLSLIKAKHKKHEEESMKACGARLRIILGIWKDLWTLLEYIELLNPLKNSRTIKSVVGLYSFDTAASLSPVTVISKVSTTEEIRLKLGDKFQSLTSADYKITAVGKKSLSKGQPQTSSATASSMLDALSKIMTH